MRGFGSAKTLAAVGAALLVVGGLAGYFFGVSSVSSKTTTSTTTTTLNAEIETPVEVNHEVTDAFAKHMLSLSSRNASVIASQFASNASVTWLGRPSCRQPIGGLYNGSKNIQFLMNVSFIGHGASFMLGNVTYRIQNITDYSAMAYSGFTFEGRNSFSGTAFIGNVNGTVSAQDVFARSADGRWLISQEIWNFTSYAEEICPVGY